jgi:hypothetical protein
MNRPFRTCLALLVGMLLVFACSPVKRVLQNEKYFEEVAQVVVKRGYCVNDTSLEQTVRVDTVIHDHFIQDTLRVALPPDCRLDTVTREGFRVMLHEGRLKVSFAGKQKEVVRTLTNTSFIRDKKLEDLLRQDILTYQVRLDSIAALLVENRTQLDATSRQLRRVEAKCFFLSVLLAIVILGGFYLRLRKLLPILP